MEYVISGTVVYGDEFELMQGYVAIKDGIISEIGTGKVESVAEGIIIPAFVNAHTHIGDSIEKDVPFMTLDELVGPGGLKHRILKETAYNDLVDSMRLAISDMISCGTALFADFRESGVMGVEALREAVSGSPIDVSIFGRQLKSGNSTLDELLLKADGL
ncbi:MAG: amidohydrolase family protein, partial [Halobacteriota archaeon]|nr:amidohydrolase family protein [Halobacteriota archaeon]